MTRSVLYVLWGVHYFFGFEKERLRVSKAKIDFVCCVDVGAEKLMQELAQRQTNPASRMPRISASRRETRSDQAADDDVVAVESQDVER